MGTLPTLFLSHGAPNSLEDSEWMETLNTLGRSLTDVRGVVVLSAHWVEQGIFAGPLAPSPLIYDFYGFPERLYRVRYPAPPGAELFEIIKSLPGMPPITAAPGRGLDHGVWVPMMGLFPAADLPVLGLSLPGTDPARLYALGQSLAPLREQGILVVGSGGMTHNLGALIPQENAPSVPWAHAFDQWATDRLEASDALSLIDFRRKAPNAALAHPTIEHFAPLFVAMGAAGETFRVSFPVDIFRYGSLSLRSAAFWSPAGSSKPEQSPRP